VFTTPLEERILEARRDARMQRLDDKPTDFSPIDTSAWSASGSIRD